MNQQKSNHTGYSKDAHRYINPIINGREITFSKIDGTSVFVSPFTKRPVKAKLTDQKDLKGKKEMVDSIHSEMWIG